MIRKEIEIISHALGTSVKKEIHVNSWKNPKMPYSEAKHMLVIIGRNNDFQKVFLM